MNSAIYGQLMVFQAIANEGSVSAAARKLGVTTPSASKALKLLEAHIGLPLFNRTTRRVELTEAGSLLLQRTGNAVQSLQYAVESVQDLGDTPIGKVRITVPRFAFQTVLQPFYAEFCQRYPHIQLEISVYDGTIDLLNEGFDLGIRFGNTIEEDMVASRLLAPFQEGLFVSADYAARYGIPQTPDELHRHRLIGYRFITARRILPLILNDNGNEVTVEMPSSLMCNDIEVMNNAVRKGLGIGRIFTPIYQWQTDKHDLIPVLQDYWRTYPAVYLYFPKNSQKAKRIRVLIDFLREKFV
ncbi:transcriptional regulator, LysR family [Pasteurella testudinis DSM 23072]|uniref:Transcriptional regulator, LysR family n=1 Tax=Pasteurella testudinis DSM 23072 TaxID=1122938 RepID=A0A1W1UG67_9PAST|nr:LysR family transcriptional regulator [Pasteurella testudinis]SMB80060.1 transcriptional regulator, LysR family [Pasteurella testudinis DSM 23072]SUB50608.1 glycine cleavage system transcriptional activator [Pasteurella testudinis]